MARRTVLRNGYVLSMDPAIGELERGSVLIEDDRIAAVERELDVADVDVIDADGGVIMPGFVDTHRHTWQTALRGLCTDWTLFDYLVGMRMTLASRCTAHDIYVGNLLGATEALDAGVTTILDFSHCNNTPEHADGGLAGLVEAGIRATYAYGYYAVPLADPHFTSHRMRIEDSQRIAADVEALPGDLISMGISLTEVPLVPLADTETEIAAARDLGALIANHTGGVWGMQSGLDQLEARGLLGPDIVHVHCTTCTTREWGYLRRSDGSISVCPETELQMGMGHPPIRRALDLDLTLSLSCDIASGNSGDMFTQMRLGLQFSRAMDNDVPIGRGENPTELSYTARDALGWATVGGARALRMEDRIGSLTPGRQADVIVVGPGNDRLNMIAPANPVGAVVQQANPSNVQTVLVAGEVKKRDGVLVGVDHARLRGLAEESCQGLLDRAEADGPLLPEPRGSFDDLAPALLPNLNLEPAGVA